MEKTKQQKTAIRSVYVAPNIEMYAAEPYQLLAGTTEFGGDAGNGDLDEINGAKKQNLNVEFRDLWEE